MKHPIRVFEGRKIRQKGCQSVIFLDTGLSLGSLYGAKRVMKNKRIYKNATASRKDAIFQIINGIKSLFFLRRKNQFLKSEQCSCQLQGYSDQFH